MPIYIDSTSIGGVKILTPCVYGDERGFFMESWNKRDFALIVLIDEDFIFNFLPTHKQNSFVASLVVFSMLLLIFDDPLQRLVNGLELN